MRFFSPSVSNVSLFFKKNNFWKDERKTKSGRRKKEAVLRSATPPWKTSSWNSINRIVTTQRKDKSREFQNITQLMQMEDVCAHARSRTSLCRRSLYHFLISEVRTRAQPCLASTPVRASVVVRLLSCLVQRNAWQGQVGYYSPNRNRHISQTYLPIKF